MACPTDGRIRQGGEPATERDGGVVAIDPGIEKCGLAVFSGAGQLISREICPRIRIVDRLAEWARTHRGATLVIGDGTGSEALQAELRASQVLQAFAAFDVINEHGSSQEGRRRKVAAERRGWRRWVPIGMLSPSGPFDDHVAEVIGRRYFAAKTSKDHTRL